MIVKYYLVINNKGTVRTTKTPPNLQWNEVVMHMQVEIPDSVFQRPQLQANVKFDGEMNYKFDYEVQHQLEEALKVLPNVHLVNVDVIKEEKDDD